MSDKETKGVIKFRPLNKAMELVRLLDKEVTYAYDDLVFIGYSEILIQLPVDDSPLNLYVHKDVGEIDRDGIVYSFQAKARELGISLFYKGTFNLVEKPGTQEVDIVFSR